MKNRYSNLMKWLCGGGAILVASTLPIFLIAKAIGQNDSDKTLYCALLMMIPIFLVYTTIIVVKSVRWFKTEKQEEQETLEKAQKVLTSEFKKVWINYSSAINKKLFDCQAKVDTDGKIICKVCLDYETKYDSYEEFLRFFNLDENS